MRTQRKNAIEKSNGRNTKNKNACLEKVAEILNVNKKVRYLHFLDDILRAARTEYKVRSRLYKIGGKGVYLSDFAHKLKKMSENEESNYVHGYIIITGNNNVNEANHAAYLDSEGRIIIDTAKKFTVSKPVVGFYVVCNKNDSEGENEIYLPYANNRQYNDFNYASETNDFELISKTTLYLHSIGTTINVNIKNI